MNSCAYCGRDNEDQVTNCSECGTAEFVVVPPSPAKQQKTERTVQIPDPEPNVSPTGERLLCTSCLFPNVPGTPFCKRCGAAIDFISTIGPLEHIYAEGHAYRQAVEGRPKPIILVGMWLLFLPSLLGALVIMFSGRHAGFLFFFLGGGLAWICVTMLYRVTKNFIRRQPQRFDEADA